ncbi:hypothetical protein P8452_18733 [Trifolium repens]|nr:hypothetical protein P8452_18733 [Trifolium repens]
MIIVELTDHSGKCECALFGDYVDEVNKKIEKSAVGLPIVVIQFAKVKIFRDKASIQNVINTTRIFVNPDIPEVETFKNSIAVHGIEVIPRFRVKLEVTDGKSTGVFVLFDSDMSHLMEKSCSFFVAQSRANNSGPHPVEFDSLAVSVQLIVLPKHCPIL